MLNLRFDIIHSCVEESFQEAFDGVLSKIKHRKGILKMTVFIEFISDSDYDSKVEWMNDQLYKKYGNVLPSVSYISQKPLSGVLSVELIYLGEDADIYYISKNDFTYARVIHGDFKILFLSGLRANSLEGIGLQGNSIFNKIEEILSDESMAPESIVRQWNYIPGITDFDNDFQHYQQFNDSRTLFYQKAKWANGYPAATGIGTLYGPLIIDLIAMEGHDEEFAIKNPRQIDAHDYSDLVLLGENDLCLKQKSTPKFERAKLIVENESAIVFVSGTAAIIGEDSLSVNDTAKQTILTFENIEGLVDPDNLDAYKKVLNSHIEQMRVYIKNESDFEIIKNICEERYPEVSFIYLLADVCRNELLIEIEAFVRCV